MTRMRKNLASRRRTVSRLPIKGHIAHNTSKTYCTSEFRGIIQHLCSNGPSGPIGGVFSPRELGISGPCHRSWPLDAALISNIPVPPHTAPAAPGQRQDRCKGRVTGLRRARSTGRKGRSSGHSFPEGRAAKWGGADITAVKLAGLPRRVAPPRGRDRGREVRTLGGEENMDVSICARVEALTSPYHTRRRTCLSHVTTSIPQMVCCRGKTRGGTPFERSRGVHANSHDSWECFRGTEKRSNLSVHSGQKTNLLAAGRPQGQVFTRNLFGCHLHVGIAIGWELGLAVSSFSSVV